MQSLVGRHADDFAGTLRQAQCLRSAGRWILQDSLEAQRAHVQLLCLLGLLRQCLLRSPVYIRHWLSRAELREISAELLKASGHCVERSMVRMVRAN